MQKTRKQLFALALALWAFSSCSQDARNPEGSATGGEAVTFRLNAEVSVDDSDLRFIDYKLGRNAKNQLVPLPQFVDKQEVDVHTILKSSNGAKVAKTLTWYYDATKKKLVLKQDDGHSITVPGFNNENGVKWYISGLIGGSLSSGTTRVRFFGGPVSSRYVDGNEGETVGRFEIPYSFGWTELKINTKSTKEANDSYKYAEIPSGVSVKFVPRGSLIAYKFGNAQTSGAYTFGLTGFTVTSNTWGTQGFFELDTDIPAVNPAKSMPLWENYRCEISRSYYQIYNDGRGPVVIPHNGMSDKTYYAWVMPHTMQPAIPEIRVMLKGTSSRPETSTYKDYMKTYFTDYTPSSGAQGKVVEGKIHKLTARATNRVPLPIEYVTEYNLAGGQGLTDTSNPQIAGVQGRLRFATSHSNDQSGYYNFFKIVGRFHKDYNPDSRNLQADIDRTFGTGNYSIPAMEQWYGVFPAPVVFFHGWDEAGVRNSTEVVRVGSDSDPLRLLYDSSYVGGFTSPRGGDLATNNAVIYAIRFKRYWSGNSCSFSFPSDYDPVTGKEKYYTYLPAVDNSMKCAYRFTRVGGASSWMGDGDNPSNKVIIDVVHLGNEFIPNELTTISDEAWWANRKAQGQVITKTFPAAGPLYTRTTRQRFGGSTHYWSSSEGSPSSGKAMAHYVSLTEDGIGANSGTEARLAHPVRLFLRRVN